MEKEKEKEKDEMIKRLLSFRPIVELEKAEQRLKKLEKEVKKNGKK